MTLLDRLPRGATLPCDAWRARHRMMVRLVWLHVAGLFLFGLARGYAVPHMLIDVSPIATLGLVAARDGLSRRIRTASVVLGLLTCSALLVHLWDGAIEAHFHFFVMVTILATYEEWFPYLLAIGYVVLHHGVSASLVSSHNVFAHADGGRHPWMWAGIHGLFICALAVANVLNWRLNEQVREQLSSSQNRFRNAFDDAPIGMAMLGPDGVIRRANRALADRTGYSTEELEGMRLDAIVLPAAEGATERRLRRKDGSSGWALCHQSPLADMADGPADIAHVLDISQRKQAERQLDHQAHHDTLTGLPNRKLFVARLEEALLGGGEGVGVLFVDLDNFKLVNDTLGHQVGDELLRAVTERMQRVLRPDDLIARFGGDEFAVLLRGMDDAPHARNVADRLAAAMRSPFLLAGEERYVTASIGISLAHDVDAPDLIRDADAAMYRAKELGKARCEVFDAELREQVVERVELESALRGALDRGELRLEYQPLVELATGRIASVEALLRWDHPELGLVPPLRFIPVAEQTGLIGDIGAWVLRTACAEAASWADPDVEVAVNVSPRQLASPAFRDHVGAALAAAGLPPQRLCLEVTESAVIADLEEADRTLRGLRQLGVRLAVDDFGVGYASLSQLKSLPPVDVLKIDRSFVSGVLNGGEDRAIVEAVVGLAHSLGLQTVAEGIESAEQGEALRALNCVLGQGYHFARPARPHAIAELLRRQGQGLGELAA